MATTKKKVSAEKITLVPLTELHERTDHPIKMREDDNKGFCIRYVRGKRKSGNKKERQFIHNGMS